jgi:hypothetical protein
MSRVTAVTVSIPERAHLLAEAGKSLRAQTYGLVPWLIRVEEPDEWGPAHIARQRNALLAAVDTEWMAVLDDDDLFDPTYLERVAEHFDDADVIYTYCRGRTHPHGPYDPERLQRENFIDGECLLRTELVREAGGYPANHMVEDWQLFRRLSGMGARFACIPEQLRDHRHGDWRTVTN